MSARNLTYIADRDTWDKEAKTINGNQVILVAKQPSKRTHRKKKNIWIYWIKNTQEIIYNQSRHGVYFMKIAANNTQMKLFYETFVQAPLTTAEKIWLDTNGYEVL